MAAFLQTQQNETINNGRLLLWTGKMTSLLRFPLSHKALHNG